MTAPLTLPTAAEIEAVARDIAAARNFAPDEFWTEFKSEAKHAIVAYRAVRRLEEGGSASAIMAGASG